MRFMKKLINYIDRDVESSFPSLNSWSSLFFIWPLLLSLPFFTYFQPEDHIRHLIVFIIAIPTIILFGLWAWRVVLIAKKYYLGVLNDRQDEVNK